MTGKQLYEQALTLLGLEQEQVDYLERMAVGCINQLLYDRNDAQNALLQVQNGTTARRMSAIPLDSLEEEIPYDERFVQECFPYGLAALLIAEDDRTMFNWLMSEYEQHAAYYTPCIETPIRGTDL
ncbi:MAG: hypothetical protein Q4D42_00980 [Eubacteriales bacterium]|nr:hypothetical protein [Eubacteriales bacterium]